MENVAKVFCGVDISKKYLDVYLHPVKKSFRVKNSPQGLKQLIQELSAYDIERVGYEATGKYERQLTKVLNSAGYKTWLINPQRIKYFAASEGRKAKTDKLDAQVIALFVASKQCPYEMHQCSPNEENLRSLVKRKDELVQMIVQEQLRLKQADHVFCEQSLKSHISYMQQEKEKIEEKLNILIESDEKQKKNIEVITSIPGVGKTTATVLIATMPELGKLRRKQIAALAGVVPYTKQSGTYQGVERTFPSRNLPKKALFMAAMVGMRHNKKLKKFYDRLIENGKKPMVALVALMHKLIVIINAMVRDGKTWNKNAPII